MRKSFSRFHAIISEISTHLWWSFPFRKDQKERIKTFGFTNFSFLFINTAEYRNWKDARFISVTETDKTVGNNDGTSQFELKNIYTDSPIKVEPINSIAIIIHVYYLELFDELLAKIEKSDFVRVKYYVTSPAELSKDIHLRLKQLSVVYEYFSFENKGRDILPFLRVMPKVIEDGFQIILKIHTKKSVQLKTGYKWVSELYQKLLGEKSMKSILHLFDSCPEIGIVGPAGHIVPMNLYYGANSKRLKAICTALNVPIPCLHDMSFVAGSMFYARVQSLIPLLNLDLHADDFEQELGQVDGTLAHAVERVFAVSAFASGLRLVDSAYHKKDGKVLVTLDHKFAR